MEFGGGVSLQELEMFPSMPPLRGGHLTLTGETPINPASKTQASLRTGEAVGTRVQWGWTRFSP